MSTTVAATDSSDKDTDAELEAYITRLGWLITNPCNFVAGLNLRVGRSLTVEQLATHRYMRGTADATTADIIRTAKIAFAYSLTNFKDLLSVVYDTNGLDHDFHICYEHRWLVTKIRGVYADLLWTRTEVLFYETYGPAERAKLVELVRGTE